MPGFTFPEGAAARSALRELGATLKAAKEAYIAKRGAPAGHRATQWAIIEIALTDLTPPPATGSRSLKGMNLQARETAFIGAIYHVMMAIRKSYTGPISGNFANVANAELWGALNHLDALQGMEEKDVKTALEGFYNYYKDHCINLGEKNPYKKPLGAHFTKFSQRVCRWVTGCDPVGLDSPGDFIADGRHEKKFDLALIPQVLPTPKPAPKAEKPAGKPKEAGTGWMPSWFGGKATTAPTPTCEIPPGVSVEKELADAAGQDDQANPFACN